MSKHTPGSWNIHESSKGAQPFVVQSKGNEGEYIAFSQWVSAGNKIIGEIYMNTAKGGWPKVESVGECKANAELIAASPDLLEALKALLEAVDDVSDDFGWPLATDKARAAINKAEGEA